jgi:hypothetical protein
MHDGHPGAIVAEVNVVGDEPWLVRLDEVDQFFLAAFSSSSAPSRTSEVSTYTIASDIRVPRAARPPFGANGAWIKSYIEAVPGRGGLCSSMIARTEP